MSSQIIFFSSSQLCQRYNKTSRTLARWVKDPPSGFPLPVQVNNRNLWRLDELEAWERSLAAEAKRHQSARAPEEVE